MILAHLQNLPKNVGDLGKLCVAKGIKKLPKVQKIAKSGHTAPVLKDVQLSIFFSKTRRRRQDPKTKDKDKSFSIKNDYLIG